MTSSALQALSRLGTLRTTILMTVSSAFMSLTVAWLLSFVVVSVNDFSTHLWLAFIIPFFVTPGFSVLTALSLRESRRARRAAYEMAHSDPLTGVANRRAFFDADAEKRRVEDVTDRALLFLDIDHFKMVNDSFGHEAGDAVLIHLAGILRENVRRDDVVVRFGGEEFVILCRNCEADEAIELARRILDIVRGQSVKLATHEIRYTVSIGIAVGPPRVSTSQLLAEADAQLYRVKASGRNDCRLSRALPAGGTSPMPLPPRIQSRAA